ncbi:hypothetical protein CDAR_121241 [Caerostris darwini]|uniref:Uncharacterized protein n=1 Tax=Caerostris darwini TaxID=1538125 RepID=A0AAV4VG74_9ARAC|nr:hypothetical protein CDAR_121241 [Caerostris darwini]
MVRKKDNSDWFPVCDFRILIASKTHEEHITHLTAPFQRLDHYGLTLKSSKYTLGASSLTYLGLRVSKKGNEPLRNRIEAIQNFPRLQAITKLRKFLAHCIPTTTYRQQANGLIERFRRLLKKAIKAHENS